MSWVTLSTMIFTIGSVYGGLALTLWMALFRKPRQDDTLTLHEATQDEEISPL